MSVNRNAAFMMRQCPIGRARWISINPWQVKLRCAAEACWKLAAAPVGLPGRQDSGEKPMIRIMSFNIRYSLADDGINGWDNRKALVIDRIRAADPDLLGLQECRDDHQAVYIRENLPDYQFYGVPRGGGDQTALEMAPVLFRKSSFQHMQSGHFWLSQTPQIPGSKSWDSAFARTATWVQLFHPASSTTLIFLNTHFDYQPGAIRGAARLLKQWAKQNLSNTPVIITGDFNADKTSAAYHRLTGDGKLVDVYREIHPDAADDITFHGFGHPELYSSIDWILASRAFQPRAAVIDTSHSAGRYPSDHYPLIAELD